MFYYGHAASSTIHVRDLHQPILIGSRDDTHRWRLSRDDVVYTSSVGMCRIPRFEIRPEPETKSLILVSDAVYIYLRQRHKCKQTILLDYCINLKNIHSFIHYYNADARTPMCEVGGGDCRVLLNWEWEPEVSGIGQQFGRNRNWNRISGTSLVMSRNGLLCANPRRLPSALVSKVSKIRLIRLTWTRCLMKFYMLLILRQNYCACETSLILSLMMWF